MRAARSRPVLRMRDDSSTCLRLKAMGKRYKPGDTACERRQFIAPRFRLPRRDIAQVNLGHPACRARRRADGASATVCKAACLNTQQTVKNEQFAMTWRWRASRQLLR